MKIGLLPGTFDPVHLGHVAMARAALAAGELDEVWLLVDSQPAYKVNVLSFEHRLAMARLAVEAEAGIRLVEVLADAEPVPHTMAGFGRLMSRFAEHQFVFIVGLDTIGRLDTWDNVQSVVENTSLMVADRAGLAATVMGDLRRRLGPLGEQLKLQAFALQGAQAASSTVIRWQIAAGERPEFLDQRVYEYIVQQGLYL